LDQAEKQIIQFNYQLNSEISNNTEQVKGFEQAIDALNKELQHKNDEVGMGCKNSVKSQE
jgi:hypothetical protein